MGGADGVGGDRAAVDRVAEGDGDAEGAEALDALQLVELELLDLAGQVAEAL